MTAHQPSLDAYWMPFTDNRSFKAHPRLIAKAHGMHYETDDGRRLLDASAGLWCVNLGHGRQEIAAAVGEQLRTLDYAAAFQMGHPMAFELAQRLTQHTPGDLNRVFFTNSGSESVDTALKIALAYHRMRGEGQRVRFIGREKGYHGVGFGGMSVGGIAGNRKFFGSGLPGVDHLPHTLNLQHNAFHRGEAPWGAHLADVLEDLIALHDASTIAAVIVEPVAGSAGVIPPPQGYLRRLRDICDAYDILLIFDEVITGFGRLGQPFASQRFAVIPDMITAAKGITNGAIPMGAVFIRQGIHDAIMDVKGPGIELFHGYTYSGHPAACAAALTALDLYEKEGLFTRVRDLEPHWQNAVHALQGAPHVRDIRSIGLMAAVDLEPMTGKPGSRGFEAYLRCYAKGLAMRSTGDILAFSPPLIVSPEQIDAIFATVNEVLHELP